MPSKKHEPEKIIGKLRKVEIVLSHVASTTKACGRIADSEPDLAAVSISP